MLAVDSSSSAPIKPQPALLARSHLSLRLCSLPASLKTRQDRQKTTRRHTHKQSHGCLHRDQAVRGPRPPVRRDAVGDAAPGLGRQVPDAPRPRRVHARVPRRGNRRRGAPPAAGAGSRRGGRRAGEEAAQVPGGRSTRRARGSAGALLPFRGAHRGGRAGPPRRAVLRRGRLLRGGRRELHPGRRQLPGAAAAAGQGAARAVPHVGDVARRAAQQPRHDTGHHVHLRRLRDRPAHQPRGCGRHRRGTVPERRRRLRPRAAGAPRQARLGPGQLPRPGYQAWPAPGAAGAGPGVHRVRLPRPLPRQCQVAVRRVHRREDLLGLRHRHRQALAVPDARRRRGPRHGREALLLRERAPRAEAGAGLLRQRHLPREGVRAGGEGGGVVGARARGHGAGREAANGRGVPVLGRGPHRRPRPVPDDVQLRVRVRVRLEQARVQRRGLRVRRANGGRAAGELRPHRVGHRHEGAGAARRHKAAGQLRHQGARRRLRPQDEGGSRVSVLASRERCVCEPAVRTW